MKAVLQKADYKIGEKIEKEELLKRAVRLGNEIFVDENGVLSKLKAFVKEAHALAKELRAKESD